AAQTDAQFTQYYEVPAYYNPAATGVGDLLRLRGGGRMQWVGIDNAPKSYLITADMPLKLGKKRIGVGIVAENESQGLFSSMQLSAQGSYKIKLFGGTMSLGLQLGMYDQKFRGSEVFIPDDNDYHEPGDDAIPTSDIHGTALDIAIGAWYTRKNIWAGIGLTHATSPAITLKSEGSEGASAAVTEYEFKANRTLYFMAGCNIPINNTLIEVMPSILLKSDFTFTTGEAMLRGRFKKMFSLGLGYRYNDAVLITLSAELKNFYIGYSYDYSTSAIAKASSGSHEVFLGYSLKLDLSDKNKNKHKSIRIM
ncbi:MAG: type IX secretion system membrane protein PorP/SprF, partial [Clostridium sp.]|nr:type IX secretion system membrane protein PorP/SprF [Clostridium sp.]